MAVPDLVQITTGSLGGSAVEGVGLFLMWYSIKMLSVSSDLSCWCVNDIRSWCISLILLV